MHPCLENLARLLGFWCAVCLLATTAQGGTDTPASANKPSTAQAEVTLLKPPLEMPGLQRTRQIRLYLPPGYATTTRRYPVLYMHDGQNLFDDATAYAGEWRVDETLNALARAGKLELIVVGIDNGQEKRLTELNPWRNMRGEVPEGKEYLAFVVGVVKPLIDSHYRTKPDRDNTAIMGSSMGGLMSHYALVQYPNVFSKAGIFSPSYWTAPESYDYFATHNPAVDARLFFLAGEEERGAMVSDVKRVFGGYERSRPSLTVGHPSATLRLVPRAKHNEKFWGAEFERAVLWLFATPDTAVTK